MNPRTRAKQSSNVSGSEEFLVALNRCDPGSVVSRTEHLRGSIGNKPFLE